MYFLNLIFGIHFSALVDYIVPGSGGVFRITSEDDVSG